MKVWLCKSLSNTLHLNIRNLFQSTHQPNNVHKRMFVTSPLERIKSTAEKISATFINIVYIQTAEKVMEPLEAKIS